MCQVIAPIKAFTKVASSLILVCSCTCMCMYVHDGTVSGVADEIWVTIHLNAWWHIVLCHDIPFGVFSWQAGGQF